MAVASAWRTRFPLASTAAVFLAAAVCATVAGEPVSVTFVVAVVLGFYRIGSLADRRRAYAALGAALVLGFITMDRFSVSTYLGYVLTSFVVPWLIGTLRLRQLRTRELERDHQTAVERERARLARELHDLVSHNVGMIIVQAAAGDVLLDREPDRTREALHAIESGARDALLELRRLLGVLRDDDQAAELAPQPTLGRLDELLARVRAAGLDVTLRMEGEQAALAPAVDLSAYRIVQEGLTNVLKHAAATHADVVIRWRARDLEIEIVDDGSGGQASQRVGHGLAGMAERVALLGGDLEAGAREGSGFRLRAQLPIAGAAS